MVKKVMIINGSPRKNWNTAKMCESFASGAKDAGAEIEMINLYDVDFKGCRSCFACKLKNGKNFGKCSYPDGLTPILDRVSQSDILVLASPIYFGNVSGVMRCFLERMAFPFFEYKENYPSIAPKKLKTVAIYTMNVNEELSEQIYSRMFYNFEWGISGVFQKPERLIACNTYQFSDYDKYVCECFDEKVKAKQRAEQFPKDLEKAFNLGKKLTSEL